MPELLKEGDIILLMKGHRIYTMLPQHFVFSNKRGNFGELSQDVVEIGEDFHGLNTTFLIGKYVVTKTTHDGGGTGHGPGDIYPDGHHVFCQHVDHPDVQVDFYQTGAFTATIKDIEPVGRAEAVWTVKPVKVRSWKA